MNSGTARSTLLTFCLGITLGACASSSPSDPIGSGGTSGTGAAGGSATHVDGAAGAGGSGGGGAGGADGGGEDGSQADAATGGSGGAADASPAVGDDGAAVLADAASDSAGGGSAGSKQVLFIWGYGEHLPTPKATDKPMPLDVTMKARLESKGFTVTMEVDALSKEEDATGKALIVISSSINRLNMFDGMKPRFMTAAVPAFVMKDGTIEVMGLGMGTKGGFSTDVGLSKLTIVAPGDPLAAGLTGDVTVYTKGDRIIWSNPAASAKTIATVAGSPKEVAIFAYAAGATMAVGTAPAKRMAFFIHRNTDYSPDGLELFDAAVAYLVAP